MPQASRQHYCINKKVVASGKIDESCEELMKDGAGGCRFFAGVHKAGRSVMREVRACHGTWPGGLVAAAGRCWLAPVQCAAGRIRVFGLGPPSAGAGAAQAASGVPRRPAKRHLPVLQPGQLPHGSCPPASPAGKLLPLPSRVPGPAPPATFAAQVHDIEELAKAGERAKACPYFLARQMAQAADLVFCPYRRVAWLGPRGVAALRRCLAVAGCLPTEAACGAEQHQILPCAAACSTAWAAAAATAAMPLPLADHPTTQPNQN
jgi:hypothetical protein